MLGNEGILYDSLSGEKSIRCKEYSIRGISEKILNACSALKYVFILLESGGGDHLSNGQDDIAKQSLTLLRPPFRDQLVSTREHKASSLVGIRSLTPARRPLTSRCVPRNVARFHETETRNVTRPIPSLNALIRFDPSLAILFAE